MIIGVPREIKTHEYRVAMLPVGADILVRDGHTVLIEKGAGLGAGIPDDAYVAVGTEMVASTEEVYRRAELIVKVKEPQPAEISLLHSEQIVFCYFHFASSRELTEGCLKQGITAIAYETLTDREGRLPLLTPMSEIAGKLSIQEGARCLEKPMQGRGILLGGVPGVDRANVLVLGGGVVGTNATRIAAGMGANVVIMDVNHDRLRYLEEIMPANVKTVYSDPHAVEEYAAKADLIVGAVLIPGARAPRLITRETLKKMKSGAVLVDVSIDQGGCFETSHPTTHQDPTFLVDGIVHYCVTNMPGAVSRTSAYALCNATLPYCRELAKLGTDAFVEKTPGYQASLNMKGGKICHPAVSLAFPDLPCEV